MSGVIFAVNKYECFMKNKNIVRTSCGCKPSKKRYLVSSKFYRFLQKKQLRGTG